MVRGRDGLPRCSPVHRAWLMRERCRWDQTTGKGQTGALRPIEMAATRSIPPGLEFGGGEDRKKPELKVLQTHRVYQARIVVLSL